MVVLYVRLKKLPLGKSFVVQRFLADDLKLLSGTRHWLFTSRFRLRFRTGGIELVESPCGQPERKINFLTQIKKRWIGQVFFHVDADASTSRPPSRRKVPEESR